MRRLITLREAAEILTISYARAAEIVRIGLLPAVYVGRQVRIDPHQLEQFVAQGGRRLEGGWRRNQD